MQNKFKVGDKVKVVKLTHPHCESLKKEIGKEFVVHTSSSRGVCNRNSDWFYNNEIELVKDEPIIQEHTYKVGGYVKVKKLTHQYASGLYDNVVGKKFKVNAVENVAVSTVEGYYFYFDEIEPTTPDVITSPATPKKNHAWAVVNKATGKVEWIRQTRRVARKLAKFQNETSTHVYQVKKIEYEFV